MINSDWVTAVLMRILRLNLLLMEFPVLSNSGYLMSRTYCFSFKVIGFLAPGWFCVGFLWAAVDRRAALCCAWLDFQKFGGVMASLGLGTDTCWEKNTRRCNLKHQFFHIKVPIFKRCGEPQPFGFSRVFRTGWSLWHPPKQCTIKKGNPSKLTLQHLLLGNDPPKKPGNPRNLPYSSMPLKMGPI